MEPKTTGSEEVREDEGEPISYLDCLINGEDINLERHIGLLRKKEKCSFSMGCDL